MSTDTTTAEAPPLTPIIKTAEDGSHYLAGCKCGACGKLFVGERKICAACCARDQMKPVRLAETGKLYAWSIVHRSFPGVKTPFIDVVVDLADGAHLKGTLEGVVPDNSALAYDMPVKIAWREAAPVNAGGKTYLTYVFVPA